MKNLVLTLIVVLFTTSIYAQSAKEFFSNAEATLSFVGLDFSLAKMVATGETADKNKGMYEVWNGMMATEADKFEVHKVFGRKGDAVLNLDVTDAINKTVKEDEVNAHAVPKTMFDAKKLQEMVEKYNLEKVKTKYAMSFIIHSFSKTDEKSIIYAVLIDPKTKKVLWSEALEGEPGGFGYKSYWAGSVYEVIKNVKKNYKKWAKAFAK